MPLGSTNVDPTQRPPVTDRLHTETTGGAAAGAGPRLHPDGTGVGVVDDDLARDHEVVRVDLPGHGGSSRGGRGPGRRGPAARRGRRAGDLPRLLDGRPVLPASGPGPARRRSIGLVLISGTAGIDLPAERLARRRTDEAMAEQLDPAGGRVDRQGRDVRTPMAGGAAVRRHQPRAPAGWAERLANTGAGLASSLRLAGTGTQPPLWDRLGRADHAGADRHRRRRREIHRPGRADGRRHRAERHPRRGRRAPATPPTCSGPDEVAALVRGHPRPVARSATPGAPSRDPEPQGDATSARRTTNCSRAGGGQDGEQCPPRGIAVDDPDRRDGQGHGGQREEGDAGPKGVHRTGDRHQAPDGHPDQGQRHAQRRRGARPARRPTRTASVRLPAAGVRRRCRAGCWPAAGRWPAGRPPRAANHTTGRSRCRVST